MKTGCPYTLFLNLQDVRDKSCSELELYLAVYGKVELCSSLYMLSNVCCLQHIRAKDVKSSRELFAFL